MDINLNHTNPGSEENQMRVNLELSLQNEYPKILGGYNSNLKRNLKKAQKAALRISNEVSEMKSSSFSETVKVVKWKN